jgi:hypothetical protein
MEQKKLENQICIDNIISADYQKASSNWRDFAE